MPNMASQAAQPYAAFGAALAEALQDADMTGKDLARKLDVDQSRVSKWRNGHELPPTHKVEEMEQILGVSLSGVRRASATPHYELYVSAPITGLKDEDIAPHRDAVSTVVDAVRPLVTGLYWPGENITSRDDLRDRALTTETNMAVLHHCKALLYLQFTELAGPSGALIELGIGLGRRLRTTVITGPQLPLPFMLNSFDAVAARIDFLPDARTHPNCTPDEAVRLITVNGRPLLGL